MWQAWHTAAFERIKRLPRLGEMMKQMGKVTRKPQTAKEILNVVKGITIAFGGRDITQAEKN